jgi:hypothetical protein
MTAIQEFLGRPILHQEVDYDVANNALKLTLHLKGEPPEELGKPHWNPRYYESHLKERLMGLQVRSADYSSTADETRVVLEGDYQEFMEHGNRELLKDTKTPNVAKTIEDEIAQLDEAMKKETLPMNKDNTLGPAKDSTLATVQDNAALAAQIAGSNIALEKMTTILQQQLGKLDIDTSFMSTPAGRAMVKMALPTLIMTLLDLPPVQNQMPVGARKTLRDVADAAQLAAMSEGMQTLMVLCLPLLAEFAKVRGSLTEGTGINVEELFKDIADTPEPVPAENR